MASSNPAAPENNRHHQGGYRSEREFLDETLGRGAGDPDMHGFPKDHKCADPDCGTMIASDETHCNLHQ